MFRRGNNKKRAVINESDDDDDKNNELEVQSMASSSKENTNMYNK